MTKTVQPALIVKGGPAVPPKHIKVGGHKIHFRIGQSLLWTVVVTSLTVAAVAAVYYLVTQLGIFFAKSTWDSLFPYSWWPSYRHGLRDIGEPVAAAMLVHSLIYAGWKKHPEAESGLRLGVHAVVSLVSAFVMIIAGTGLIDYVLPASARSSSSNTGIAGTLDLKSFAIAFAFSFIVVHFVRFAWAPVGNAISLAFTESAVRHARGKLPLWVRRPLAPPAMRERFVWEQETMTPAELAGGHDFATRLLMIAAFLYVPLAGDGEYVLHVVAKGH